MSRLPNLLYIGADKAGSTYISGLLGVHPDIYVTPAKDTYFFTDHYDRGLAWYQRQFVGARSERYVAEVCHDYLYDPEALERIDHDLEDVRLLVCVREPFARALSAYGHLRRNGRFTGTFANALETRPSLVEHGRYSAHLPQWWDRFGRDRVSVLVFEEMAADRHRFAADLWVRLGVAALEDESLMGGIQTNEAVAARSLVLARLGKGAARALRRAGQPRSVATLKHSRFVRRVVYRSASTRPAATAAERAMFSARLGDEKQRLESLLGRSLPWESVG